MLYLLLYNSKVTTRALGVLSSYSRKQRLSLSQVTFFPFGVLPMPNERFQVLPRTLATLAQMAGMQLGNYLRPASRPRRVDQQEGRETVDWGNLVADKMVLVAD